MSAHESRRQRAPGPRGLFGLSNLAHVAIDPLSFLRDVARRYGDVARIDLLGTPWFLVSHPDDIETFFVTHARSLGRDDYVDVLKRALGQGLLTSDGELWKRQRRLMAQAFVPKRIQTYADAMARVTEVSLGRWQSGAELDLHQEMSRVTMAVVADVLFGAGLAREDADVVGQSMAVISDFFATSPEALLKMPAWLPTPRNVGLRRAVARIDALIFRIIAARRAGAAKDDLLGTLLAAQDEDGGRMDDRQLRDEAVTLFLAGHETTALALAHALFLLASHPDVERALHAEVRGALDRRLPTAADVKALPLTERVLKEAMRLYPPAWTTGREALEDLDVRGYRVPAGAQILMSQWVVHADARWFPEPDCFDPDRWLPERAKTLPRFAYFPFGGGPRTCIGNHFAMLEATLILALIVRSWRVEVMPGERLALKASVTLRPKGRGVRVRLSSRTTDAPRAHASPHAPRADGLPAAPPARAPQHASLVAGTHTIGRSLTAGYAIWTSFIGVDRHRGAHRGRTIPFRRARRAAGSGR